MDDKDFENRVKSIQHLLAEAHVQEKERAQFSLTEAGIKAQLLIALSIHEVEKTVRGLLPI